MYNPSDSDADDCDEIGNSCNSVCCWQKSTPRASHLYVSYNRKPFQRCYFPNNVHPAVREIHI